MAFQGLIGLAGLPALAWLLSEARWQVNWRTVVAGMALQLVLALLLLKLPGASGFFLLLNDAVEALQKATDTGTGFVFGYLGGAPLPFAETRPGASFILAFKALPLVLTISALASLLFHWGVLQRIVSAFAFILRHSMGIGGALGFAAAVHVFVGMIEAPLLVRPYLIRMSRGELFAMMTCGMAGVAGTMMALYANILGPVIPNALGNILIASLISTPAALAVGALMVPFAPADDESFALDDKLRSDGALDAIVKGTGDGVGLLVNIVAMLLVLVALVTLANMAIAPLTLQGVLGAVFAPVMWALGMPWSEAVTAGNLMGSKTVLNEFIAYLDLAALPDGALSAHSRLIVTYALCGFANFGSLGIVIGGLGAMVPERRPEIVALGGRSILAGTFATCMSGATVGLIL
ncbi:MAG: nucleoside transporter C-terminal domain-containing protein [Rhodospirillaceae bacterium]